MCPNLVNTQYIHQDTGFLYNPATYWSMPRNAMRVISGCLFHWRRRFQYTSSSSLLCSAYNTNKAECTLGSKTGWRSVAALTTSLQHDDNFSFQKLLQLSCRTYQLLHTVYTASPTVLKNIRHTQRPYNHKIFSMDLQKSIDRENMWESKGHSHYFFFISDFNVEAIHIGVTIKHHQMLLRLLG